MLSLLQLAFFAIPEEEEDMLVELNLPDFLWQEKCQRLFGLSKEYFYLPWTEDVTTVPERYFSLKHEKLPYKRSFTTDDECDLLADRMIYSCDNLLLQDVKDFFSQRRHKTSKMKQSKVLFEAALNSGKEDLVDEMTYQRHVWDYISLPETIAEVIRPIPFSSSFLPKDYIIKNPGQSIFSSEHIVEAIKGGNVRIVLYIEEHCPLQIKDANFLDTVFDIIQYEGKYNPQGFYSILQYINSNRDKKIRQSLCKLKTTNKDHLLFVLSALADPRNPFKPGSILNVSQEKVLRRNVIKDLNLARAFASHLTLDILTFMYKSNKAEIRAFAQDRLNKGEYSRGPIIFGGDVSNKNLSSLPPGLRL